MSTSFAADFRRFFARGLAALLPTLITISLLIWLFQTLDRYIGQYINRGAQWVVVRLHPELGVVPPPPSEVPPGVLVAPQPAPVELMWETYHLDILGFLLAIALVYILGRLVASLLGRTALAALERFVLRIPLVRTIYTSIKQVTDFFILSKTTADRFSRVVAVQYPRTGIWSLGLVTNTALPAITAVTAEEMLTVFIPSSPTPVTGYTITAYKKDVIDLDMDIEQALRFIISGGVIMPLKPKSYEQLADS